MITLRPILPGRDLQGVFSAGGDEGILLPSPAGRGEEGEEQPLPDKLWVFTRTLGDRRLLVVANMTSTMVGVPMAELPDLTDARLVLTNLPEVTGDVQTLEPWESRIYELQA